jgi:uncharacterized protein (DUF885 family)
MIFLTLFNVLPNAPRRYDALNPGARPGSSTAFYSGPTGSRPGIYYVNLMMNMDAVQSIS